MEGRGILRTYLIYEVVMKHLIIAASILFFAPSLLLASYEDALKLYDTGKHKESLTMIAGELNAPNDMAPDSPNYKLRYLAAHNHWKLGNFESALLHFQRCMKIKPDSIDPYIDSALMLSEANKLNDAQQLVQHGLKIKEDAVLYYVYGKIVLMRRDYWQAKALFEKSLALNPELYISYNSLGICLMRLERYSQANTAFVAALSIASRSPEIMNNLGYSLEKMGQADKAMPYFEKAHLLNPENPTIAANLERVKNIKHK